VGGSGHARTDTGQRAAAGGCARAAVMLLWRTDLPRVFCSLLSLLAAGCDMVGDEAKRGRGRSTSMRSRDDNSR
jgi:hypothetical protein